MLLFPTFFIVVAVVVTVAVVASKHSASGGGGSVGTSSDDWPIGFGPRRPDPTPGMLGSIEQEFMDAHNEVRQTVGAPTLQWDFMLEVYAQNYAASQNCVVDPSDGPYGENIFLGIGETVTPRDAVGAWANEVHNYNYDNNTCSDGLECNHYTQIVWMNTTNIGCAVYSCSTSAIYFICEYEPKGNLPGERPF